MKLHNQRLYHRVHLLVHKDLAENLEIKSAEGPLRLCNCLGQFLYEANPEWGLGEEKPITTSRDTLGQGLAIIQVYVAFPPQGLRVCPIYTREAHMLKTS